MESLLYLFSGFRWQDALDILLNTYILFRLYVLFRGTNVIQALLAICVFWVASQMAVSLGLIITNWAMQGVITVAALIIIIIFRNEISRVLQTKDLKAFLWGIPRQEFNTPLNIIAESVYELAKGKIGALIVLPLKQGVESVVQGGVLLGCKLSQEMLVSVFWPGNPLHDGAAILQGDRVISAGVILPLSKREDLPSFFGTRHRAAAGLAENTDALVIVVSEERGKVTLFKGNQAYKVPNPLDLENFLQEHTGKYSEKKGFKDHTREIVAAAVISLVCVTGIWLSFSKGMETLATKEVPVEFINPDQKKEIVSSSVSIVKLLISGARPLINSIKPEQINIKVNLAQVKVGQTKLSITRENVVLPPGIRLKQIEPSELDITLDARIERELPIQPNWTGKLPKGLLVKEARALPQTILVTGGSLALSEISTVFTEPIPLDKLSESGTISVGLVTSPGVKLANSNKILILYLVSKRSDL